MGSHYGGRPTDTGHGSFVNSSGGYSASIPLDLPGARGGLPVPVQLNYSERGVGAAGLGWDVPLSYIRRDTTFARRRPVGAANVAPQAREQVSLILEGKRLDLVRTATSWVARRDAPDLVIREQGDGTWVVFDGQGRTYTFAAAAPSLVGSGLWHLTSVTGPGGNRVVLNYTVGTPAVPGVSDAVSVDLSSVQYNPDATGCFKHTVTLGYSNPAASPLSIWVVGGKTFARTRVLTSVDVASRPKCGASAETLRGYQLAYQPDPDTKLLRLSAVQMTGRQGTPEAGTPVPIGMYTYGTATAGGQLTYQGAASTNVIPGADHVGFTQSDFSPHPPNTEGFYTRQSLMDVTGDGRPDFVLGNVVARNFPNAAGSSQLGVVPQEFLGTFPLETRTTDGHRYEERDSQIRDNMTFRQTIDVNGDGRLDIIDAAEQAGAWTVHLNTPDPTDARKIVMQTRVYSTVALAQRLRAKGMWTGDEFLPLSLRSTGRDDVYRICFKWSGTSWIEVEGEDALPSNCPEGGVFIRRESEKTIALWELQDINGDGYPDVVLNSTRVGISEVVSPPARPTGSNPGIRVGTRTRVVDLPGANQIEVMFNVLGVHAPSAAAQAFSAPVVIRSNAACGFSRWVATDDTHQQIACGLSDINGDGIADLVNGTSVFLGTGRRAAGEFFTGGAVMALPGALAAQLNDQQTRCAPPTETTSFQVSQLAGLRDLTGDGIPDYIVQDANGWKVLIGTGTGFAPAIPIVASAFALSSEREDCGGAKSGTTAGLFDLDGDGSADLVTTTDAAPSRLMVARLSGSASAPGAPEAGRLVRLDNGYGAQTTVTYRSAKEDATTLHQVPFPEIVVASVVTAGTQGLGGSLAVTKYAYGHAEQVFDPGLDAFTFPGYRRTVELHIPTGATAGTATISDTYGPATAADPYGVVRPGNTPIATTSSERYRAYMTVGRPSDVTVLSGNVGGEAWGLLSVNSASDARRIGATHYAWNARSLASSTDPAGSEVCPEMVLPYDHSGSEGYKNANGTYDICATHGFAFGSSVESWRGEPGAAPPSTSNVVTRREVRSVDDFGRVLIGADLNDLHRTDDDLCVETEYATPAGANERVLVAVSSRRISNCGAITYARDTWNYDKLTFGSVGVGFPTSHTVERRDGAGALLGTIRESDTNYDGLGNPIGITWTREDGATRRTSISYDPFGLVAILVNTNATGAAETKVLITRDPVTLNVLATKDPNGSVNETTYDGFDRGILSLFTPPGGRKGALAVTTYRGFAIGETPGRSVVQKSFPDPVTPATALTAPGRVGTVYLDELGRQMRADLVLGSDYPGQTMVAGRRVYDSFGRVVFEADPFPSSQALATAYGTTHFFNTDGTPSCSVRGNGQLTAVTRVSAESTETYPTCYSRAFENHTEVVGLQDAASLLPGSPQAGVVKTSTATAAGRVIMRSTRQAGARLEHATFDYDALGHVVGMTRYQDAVAGSKPVTWAWRFDSLGQILELNEPGSVPQLNAYSNWGELLSVSRLLNGAGGSTTTMAVVNQYDGLGRLLRSEQRDNGVVDAATVKRYLYDTPIGLAPQVTPTNVLGRLAQASSPTGAVAFSYDELGQVNARVFTDAQSGMYVEKHTFHGDGSPAALDLFLPDTAYADEHVEYKYDSAGRGTSAIYSNGASTQTLFSASTIDSFGRVRQARYGAASYAATYADVGRRLPSQVSVSSTRGSRSVSFESFDPLGRERSRTELKSGSPGSTMSYLYDALGRLTTASSSPGRPSSFSQAFTYDPLGNIITVVDGVSTGGPDTSVTTRLSYLDADRDRICRISYGPDSGTACNVVYDQVGNITSQPTRTGTRQLAYFADGNVRSVTDGTTVAQFRYDAFGQVQELDLTSNTSPDTRHDRRYGGLIAWRDEAGGAVLSRRIPGPGGLAATRHGAGGSWVFEFGEARGNRFFVDETGAFVQDVDYKPFGEALSTGAQPGSHTYSNEQWNGGDALAALGLSHLGARLYDPAIGRFLSRDPLLIPRTAATTNPYAFASNDPINKSDPTGLDEGLNDPRRGGEQCVVCGSGGPPNQMGPKLKRLFHNIGSFASTVGHAVGDAFEDTWDWMFGGESSTSAPAPTYPTADSMPIRVMHVPTPVFAPAHHAWPDDLPSSRTEMLDGSPESYDRARMRAVGTGIGVAGVLGGATVTSAVNAAVATITRWAAPPIVAATQLPVQSMIARGGGEVTVEMVQNAVSGSVLQIQQTAISLPVIQNYVGRALSGELAPAIKMEGNIIVDGVHRYVAGLLTNVMPSVQAWVAPGSATRFELSKVLVDVADWGNR